MGAIRIGAVEVALTFSLQNQYNAWELSLLRFSVISVLYRPMQSQSLPEDLTRH